MREHNATLERMYTRLLEAGKTLKTKKGAVAAASTIISIVAIALLFVGGITLQSQPSTSAETAFEPVSTTMSDALPSPMMEHACVENPAPGDVSSDNIVCFGGYAYRGGDGGNDIDDVLEYDIVRDDPTESSIENSNNLPSERLGLSCAEDSNENVVYCFGGFEYPFGDHLDQILRYDATSDSLGVMGDSMERPRMSHSCVESSTENAAYCFGGYNNESGTNNYTTRVAKYDYATDTLSIVTDGAGTELSYRRIGHSCAEDRSSGLLYCFGGYNGTHHTDDIWEFNASASNPLQVVGQLPSPRSGLSCTESLIGRIYCFGGYNTSKVLDEIVEFNPDDDSASIISSLPEQVTSQSCAEDTSTESRGSNIYCTGGFNGSHYLDSIFRYTYATSAPVVECDGCITPQTAVVGEEIRIDPTIRSRTDTPITEVRICKTRQCSASEVEEEGIICESGDCTYTSQRFEQTDVYVWARDRPGNTVIQRIGSVSFRLGRGEFCNRDDQCLGGECRNNACLGGYPPPIVEFLG